MARIALTSFRLNPTLNKCDPRSILAAVITASQFGWEIGVHAYLVPYRNERTGSYECQLVPAWHGLVELASRSGRASVWTGVVYEGDDFNYGLGDSPFIHHKPYGIDENPEKMTHAYAVGRTTGAQYPVIEVWHVDKIKKHRDRYNRQRPPEKHYSFQHFEMYARKVVLLQVMKYMPKSVELQTAIELEYENENPKQVDVIDTSDFLSLPQPPEPTLPPETPKPEPEPPKQNTVEAVKDKLKKDREDKPPVTEQQLTDAWPKREKPDEKKEKGKLDDHDNLPF